MQHFHLTILHLNLKYNLLLGVNKGCEPACLVGCCGYHGRYGWGPNQANWKSKRWIIENIINKSDELHDDEE